MIENTINEFREIYKLVLDNNDRLIDECIEFCFDELFLHSNQSIAEITRESFDGYFNCSDEKVIKKVSEDDRLDKPYVCNCDAVLDPKYIIALIDKVNGRIIRFNEDRKVYKFGYKGSK